MQHTITLRKKPAHQSLTLKGAKVAQVAGYAEMVLPFLTSFFLRQFPEYQELTLTLSLFLMGGFGMVATQGANTAIQGRIQVGDLYSRPGHLGRDTGREIDSLPELGIPVTPADSDKNEPGAWS
jgi:hypothetical protein